MTEDPGAGKRNPEDASPGPGAPAADGDASAPVPAAGAQRSFDRRRQAAMAGAVAGAVATTLIAGAVAATWPLWAPTLFPWTQQAAEDPRVGSLTSRLETLEATVKARTGEASALKDLEQERAQIREALTSQMARLGQVEQAVAGVRQIASATTAPATAADASASLRELSDRLSRVETRDRAVESALARLKALEEKGAERALAQDVTNLSARLAELERMDFASAEARTGARATVVAVAQLREATRTAAPFAAALEAMRAVAQPTPEMRSAMAALEPHAAKGVPTLAGLRERFAAAARRIAAAGGALPGEGLVERTLNRLRSLVVVRRIGDGAEPGSIDEVLARVDADLREGDLAEAVEALKGLKGEPLEAAREWLAEAEARLAVERALAILHVQAVAMVAPARK